MKLPLCRMQLKLHRPRHETQWGQRKPLRNAASSEALALGIFLGTRPAHRENSQLHRSAHRPVVQATTNGL